MMRAMGLEIRERNVTRATCEACGTGYEFVKGFVYRNGDAYAVYFAACHGHPEDEAVLDVILGTWGDDDINDRVTFSACVRLDGASAIDATAAAAGQSDIFGQKLARDEALAHPLITAFWDVLDHVVVEDDDIAAAIYGPG